MQERLRQFEGTMNIESGEFWNAYIRDDPNSQNQTLGRTDED